MEFDISYPADETWSKLDRVRLGGIMFRALAMDMPRLLFHRTVHLGDYSYERKEKDMAMDEAWDVKASRLILEKEIGPLSFRIQHADRLHEIKERRDLPSSTLVREM